MPSRNPDISIRHLWIKLASRRLAPVNGDAVIMVPEIAFAYRSRMTVADLSSSDAMAVFNALQAAMEQAGLIKKATWSVCGANGTRQPCRRADNERFLRAIRAKTGAGNVKLPYSVLKRLPNLLRENNFSLRCISERHGDSLEILDLLPNTDTLPICGQLGPGYRPRRLYPVF